MIIDTRSHASCYSSLLPGLPAAFAFLERPDVADLADGRYPIDGENIFALVQTYDTKPVADGLPEAHRRYADIQAVVSGKEVLGYAPLADQPIIHPYDLEKDILFIRGNTTLFTLTPGLFALLLPQDAHLPGRMIDKPEHVRKIVIKILLPDFVRS